MRLKEEKALELTIEMWDWLGESDGRHKGGWAGWKKHGGKYPQVRHDCFLCEYSGMKEGHASPETCKKCPYYQNYGLCCEGGLFTKWERTHSKDYARQFAHRLKVILHNKRNPENKKVLLGDTEYDENTVKVMGAFHDFLGKVLNPKPDETPEDYGCIISTESRPYSYISISDNP